MFAIAPLSDVSAFAFASAILARRRDVMLTLESSLTFGSDPERLLHRRYKPKPQSSHRDSRGTISSSFLFSLSCFFSSRQ